jgi:peptide/nickel transport system substrate-binding protein
VIVTPAVAGEGAGLTSSSVDPAVYSSANPPAFTGLTYDSLVTFQHSPGTDGLLLVPDLALVIPTATATDDCETYAFRIRPGIRYSDAQKLRAEDFRRGIERLFMVRSIYSALFAGIDGAAACAQRPARCDLSRGIETNDAAGTVVFHLVAPDPEFLFKLTEQAYAAPKPPGTPDREPASRAVPGPAHTRSLPPATPRRGSPAIPTSTSGHTPLSPWEILTGSCGEAWPVSRPP